jgi:hypothetical protein
VVARAEMGYKKEIKCFTEAICVDGQMMFRRWFDDSFDVVICGGSSDVKMGCVMVTERW